ncbi:hypothetical protein [Nocardia pneumoniae]|uniref:hypothetical protein n=1 Tax=Nocardia pneumoniae TaxID=228601 RepID=UPI0005940ED5|nr:hypothetical protein [Nocardia pneumoniae]
MNVDLVATLANWTRLYAPEPVMMRTIRRSATHRCHEFERQLGHVDRRPWATAREFPAGPVIACSAYSAATVIWASST